ncbi:MAG TPA: M23 family metallopeptidase [Verrucomicrobiae bacterium]|nr:M23 family metallopeptidase [Verrucomicrobiae bacterium]
MPRRPHVRCRPRRETRAAAGLLAALLLFVTPGSAAPPEKVAPATGAPRAELLWPLERNPREIVSAFGEYRYDHLHAGLDLSTGGAVGLPVRALGDGEVYRLKVEWRGYGRALYLRLRDGRRVVYGHLDRYDERTLHLETRVERRRKESGNRFPGNIELEPGVPVRRGQVVAYSGESGVGPPHLHVELRDAEDRPIDPFTAGLPRPASGPAPAFETLILTAAAPGTFFDGRLRTARVELRRRDGVFEAERPIAVCGAFDAAVSAWDPSGGGRAGIGFLEASIDGTPVYRFDPQRFGFDQGPMAGLLFDHRDSRLGPARYAYRLGVLPGNALAVDPRGGTDAGPGPAGAFAPAAGEHRLELRARSSSGGWSRAAATIRMEVPARDTTAATAASASVLAAEAPALTAEALPRFLDLRAGDGEAAAAALAAGPAGGGVPSWRRLPGGVNAAGLAWSDLALLGTGGKTRLLEALGAASIDVVDRATGVRRDGDGYFVDLPAGARFFTGPLVVRVTAAAAVPEGLVVLSPAVELLPDGESLDAAGRLGFPLAAGAPPEKSGVFRFDAGSGRWGYEGDRLESGAIVQTFRRYGRFALLRDDAAPIVSDVEPPAGRTVGTRPVLSARAGDAGKGLDWDGVRFELDGRRLVSEFDPDRGLSKVVESLALTPGTHRLVVTAIDRAGNTSAPIAREFVVRATR